MEPGAPVAPTLPTLLEGARRPEAKLGGQGKLGRERGEPENNPIGKRDGRAEGKASRALAGSGDPCRYLPGSSAS